MQCPSNNTRDHRRKGQNIFFRLHFSWENLTRGQRQGAESGAKVLRLMFLLLTIPKLKVPQLKEFLPLKVHNDSKLRSCKVPTAHFSYAKVSRGASSYSCKVPIGLKFLQLQCFYTQWSLSLKVPKVQSIQNSYGSKFLWVQSSYGLKILWVALANLSSHLTPPRSHLVI